jgi:hypothetical protein
MTERTSRIIRSALNGARRGGPAGAVLSILTGAAVIITIPAWVPFVAAGWFISVGTVMIFGAIGSAVGAVLGALKEKRAIQREDRDFKKHFGL